MSTSSGRAHKIQELLAHLGSLQKRQFMSRDALLRHLQASVGGADVPLCLDTIERAGSLGILGSMGDQYLVRRSPTPEDFTRVISEDTDPGIPTMGARMSRMQTQVDSLLNLVNAPVQLPVHHWLTLNLETMPRVTRDILRSQALGVLHEGASDLDVERQMSAIAARLLVHAFRPQRGHDPA